MVTSSDWGPVCCPSLILQHLRSYVNKGLVKVRVQTISRMKVIGQLSAESQNSIEYNKPSSMVSACLLYSQPQMISACGFAALCQL